ncbi:hypothetical protein [Ekhidna sp.]|uniref:hypothetical protein n=1 Tax=Ekhidna sp. TaxID=2608089 RepID=UPI003B58DBAE
MKSLYNKLIISTFALAALACSSEDDLIEDWIDVNETEEPAPGTSGDLDLSSYISIGNSLTAGFADGALYNQGQENSFPNLLAGQFAMVGGGNFNQPDINSVDGYHTSLNPSGVEGLIFGRTVLDLSAQAPVPTTTGEEIGAYTGNKANLGNFGVPGLRLSQLETAGYGFPGAGNAFFTRFATDPNTSSVLGDALAVDRSFFTLWLGANDYLGYATSGGQGNTPLTDFSGTDFGTALGSALGQLTADGTPGVVLDLPPVVTLPFFQAISWDRIELDAATAETLNNGLASVNGALQGTLSAGYSDSDDIARRLISYSEGNNPILVHDEELVDLEPYFDNLEAGMAITAQQRAALVPYEQSRPLVDGELVLLSAGAVLGTEADGDDTVEDTPIGVVIPLGFSFTEAANGDQYFLNAAEQAAIVTARATYNGAISATVTALNDGGADIGLVSVQPLFVDMLGLDAATATALALPTGSADGVQGIEVDGVTLTPDFAPNGVFSSDGIHPNPRGHAIVANEIIAVMNARWNANIPTISVLEKLGVTFQP